MGKPINILFIEDREDDAVLAIEEVRRGGYEPDYLRVDTQSAMQQALAERRWDLVLCDHNMPQFCSTRAFQCLRESNQDIPFIIISGTIEEEAAVQAMKFGAHDYLQKGKLGRLVAAIDRELREARIRSQRCQVVAKLQESEKRFQLFMDHSPAISFIKDSAGRYVYLSKAIEKTGHTAKDLIGRTGYEIFPEDVARQLRQSELEVLATGIAAQMEITIPSATDGHPIHYFVHSFSFQDQSGNRFLGGKMLDITERKRLEDQLRQSQKMEAFGQLAGGIAHDFNNILSVIIGYGDRVRSRLPEEDALYGSVDKILRSANRAADLTRQLLAFGRKDVIAPRVLDLRTPLKNVEDMLRRLIGEDIELCFEQNPDELKVMADPSQIEQVALNLAVNARDAMPNGGKLTITVTKVRIKESTSPPGSGPRPGSYVILSVADTGIGMSEEIRTHIFEPFFTTKAPGKGTGLGLATVYGIVKQAKGYITVDSQVGLGTTFKVYFPEATEAVATPASRVTPAPKRGYETIMVVEDNDGVRTLLKETLQANGYKTIEARHGGEALQIGKEYSETIHLMITDVVMPEISGARLAKELSTLHPEMRVIFTSGYTDEAIQRTGIQDSEMSFLQKPFAPDSVTALVREVLDADTQFRDRSEAA